MGDDVFDGLTGVVPGAIATGAVGGRSSGAGRRVDRPLSRDDIHMLAGVPLFAGLSRRHLRRLAEHADLTSFREGQAVVREGQAGGTFYVIVQGEAKVQRRGRTIGTLGPGEFFGEISLLDGGPRTADVVAATPLVAIRVFKQAFDRVLVEERGVAAKILAGVVAFVLFHGVSVAVALRLRKERDRGRIAALLQLSGSTVQGMYAGLGWLIVFGTIAGIKGGWWNDGWFWLSIIVLVLVVAEMSAVARPYYQRVKEAVEMRPSGVPRKSDEELDEILGSRVGVVNMWVGFAALAVITWLMIFKPFVV